jgi:DNA-binding response OmpR family regulator
LYHGNESEIIDLMDKGKVLLVEDDLFLREIYVQVLQTEGYTVLTADDGEAGLHMGQTNLDARIMLLDIMLPKMHGIEVLKQLKANPATQKLPVVILTNLTEETVVQEALHLGAAGYLVKVRFTPQQVVEKVKEYIKFNEHQQPPQQ